MILGRPSVNILGAIVSTPYLVLKFPVSPTEVGVIHANQKEARRCYHESLGKKKRKEIEIEGTQEAHVVETDQNKNMSIGDLDPREEKKGEARAQR